MEEIKQGWKKRISWLLIALTVVIVYKMLDNFSNVTEWFGTFFRILKPFFAGLLISYILFMPCKKIENALSKSKESKRIISNSNIYNFCANNGNHNKLYISSIKRKHSRIS